MDDLISRQEAIDALWGALYEYEDKTKKRFIESEELDAADWFQHSIFVQNMSDIDRQTILNLPSTQSRQKTGKWIDAKSGSGQLGKVCSACGHEAYWDSEEGQRLFDWCPYCGSYNGEESENEWRKWMI